jgi:Xaa-Pro aminopeptidase
MIKAEEFRKRRQQLLTTLGDGAIAILPSAEEKLRNGDVHYPFRQDSDFWYLTGFPEPDAVLVLCHGCSEGEHILFCREADPEKMIWDGPMLGTRGAQQQLLFDAVYDIKAIDSIMPGLLKGRERICYPVGKDQAFDLKVLNWNKAVATRKGEKSRAPEKFTNILHHVHDMRLYKSRDEVRCMKKAADIAAEAHQRMMRAAAPGKNESDLLAEYLHTLASHRSQPSYTPIIGGGANACILHYIKNDQPLRDGDLVLVDAGAEYDLYASDITRTFPVNGRFSPEQKAIYEIVLAAHSAALEQVHPGKQWNCPHDAAVRVIAQGLVDLGLLKGSLETVLEDQLYAEFFMHKTGHWLGLDVHDCGDYQVDKLWVEMEPGMVLTIEPGIYISPQAKVDKKWRGIGVRIEDDVLVTRKGPQILSDKVPRDIASIEALMAS